MILSKYVDVKISNNQIKYFKEKGYNIKGGNEIVSIKVIDLLNGSGVKIKAKCDICGKETEINFNRYIINTKKLSTYYACSRKCADQKSKDTILNKYGVENISNSKIIKDKKIETCLKNFGVEYPQQSNKIFQKSKDTKLEKYGDKNYSNYKKATITKRKELIKKYNAIDYDGQFLTLNCKKNHIYKITLDLYFNRIKIKTDICTICNPYKSNESPNEVKIYEFIKNIYSNEIKLKDRSILSGKELDIYLPELKLAFEYNGLYWHNELYKENNYHLNKTEQCEAQGIQLIHIWEDDWRYKEDIVKSIILNFLNKIPHIVFSTKTIVKEIYENDLVKDFLNKNYINESIESDIKLGLYYNNELVSLMTFKKINEYDYELLQFCNKINFYINEGDSKLFKYFINNYKYNNIITYVDRSYSQGDLYKKLGFKFINKTKSEYYYIIEGLRYNKNNFKKEILVKEGYNINKTEREIMLERKIYRIYNSGNLKFIYK